MSPVLTMGRAVRQDSAASDQRHAEGAPTRSYRPLAWVTMHLVLGMGRELRRGPSLFAAPRDSGVSGAGHGGRNVQQALPIPEAEG